MYPPISALNVPGILAASIAHFALGGIWFMALFGRQYAIALGIADQPRQSPAPRFIVGPLLCSAATIVTSDILLRALAVSSLADAIGLGTLIGLGYLAPMTINIAINPLFPRPFHYALINVPMFLIGSIMSCMILFALS